MDRGQSNLFKSLFPLLGLIIVAFGFKALGLLDFFDTAWADHNLVGHGVPGMVLFFALGAGLTAIGLPRQIICFVAGYAYGLVAGVALGMAATLGGCCLGFFSARYLGQAFFIRRYPRQTQRINAALSRNPFSMTLLIRLAPVGANALTNLLGGVSAVPARYFLSGTLLGQLPQTIIFALLGSGVRVDPFWRIAVSVVLLVLTTLLGLWLYRRYRLEQAVSGSDV